MNSILNVILTCPFCGAEHSVSVYEADYDNWVAGGLAQDVFPYLSSTEREQLISQLCPSCQEEVFGEDEDPDYDYDLEVGFDPYEGCYSFDC